MINRIISFFIVFSCFMIASLNANAALPKFSKIYYFGDSLSDVGNYVPDAPWPCWDVAAPVTNPKDSGTKYTENYVWTNYLNKDFGDLPVTPGSLTDPHGTDWAYSGAESYINKFNPAKISVLTQVNNYLGNNQVDPNALYSIWVGANDLNDKVFFPELEGQTVTPQQVAQTILYGTNAVQASLLKLYLAGARNFLIINVPDISRTPIVMKLNKPELQKKVAEVVTDWNQQEDKDLLAFKAYYPDVKIYYLDSFKYFDQVINNPEQYGFPSTIDNKPNNAINWCTQAKSQNADDYLFFNAIHPTTHAHKVIAELVEKDSQLMS